MPSYWCPDFSRPKSYSKLPKNFHDCECYDGYHRDEHSHKCIPPKFHCPENSVPIVEHPESFCDCECIPGFTKEGQKCIPVEEECKIQVDKKVCVVPPPKPPVSGDLCDLDKLEGLDLLFNLGNDLVTTQETPKKAGIRESLPTGVSCKDGPFDVQVTDKDDDALATAELSCGDVFSVSGDFDSQSFFKVSLGGELIQLVEIHTSCSQPLTFEDVYGSFIIVGFDPKDGDKVEFMPMDDNDQLGPCKSDPYGDVEAHVGDNVVFTNIVTNLGDVAITGVEIESAKSLIGGGELKEFVPSFVGGDSNGNGLLDPTEEWVYTANFEVTESTPVGEYMCLSVVTGLPFVADKNGDIPDNLCEAEDKVTYTIVEKPKFVGDICEDDFCDKPVAITFLYRGGNDITNDQEGKAFADGDNSPPADPATIFAEKYDFDLSGVNVGDVFTVTNDDDKFDSNTEIEILGPDGSFVQFIEYHTSCSKPINIGDVIGSLMVESVTCENGNTF